MTAMPSLVPKPFYADDPAMVAERLLGQVLVRVIEGNRLACMIVETEAYYGPGDPASRARRRGDLRRVVFGDVGTALVYGIHRQWLLNVVAHEEGEAGAVLIRSCEPLEGISLMKKLRGVEKVENLTNGPGKLTKAMKIDKSFHGKPVYVEDHGLWIEKGRSIDRGEIARSRRIGVSEDLETPLRFFLIDNKYVSRRVV